MREAGESCDHLRSYKFTAHLTREKRTRKNRRAPDAMMGKQLDVCFKTNQWRNHIKRVINWLFCMFVFLSPKEKPHSPPVLNTKPSHKRIWFEFAHNLQFVAAHILAKRKICIIFALRMPMCDLVFEMSLNAALWSYLWNIYVFYLFTAIITNWQFAVVKKA